MNLAETLLRRLDDPALSRDELVQLRCRAAEEFERRGQYEAARDALGGFWRGVGVRPPIDGLGELMAAELLLRAGALSGRFGSARQLEGAQGAAKDLISESITRFQSLGETARAAAAQNELGFCYYRAGEYGNARVYYLEALKGLADDSGPDLRAEILLRLSMAEFASGRYIEALRILTDAAELFERIGNHSLRGKFHNDFGCVLTFLAKAERRPDYADRAIIEYTAASHYFEQTGHTRNRARAENNLGFLLYTIGRHQDAHEHLDRARRLFAGVGDKGSVAQVDETRARVLLAQGATRKAERVIRDAVRVLEKGDAQAKLAEALTTEGRIFAKLGSFAESMSTLRRAAKIAEIAGTVEDAGLALLTLIEEHADRLGEYELLENYRRADSLLKGTQDAETIARLRACAGRIVAVRLDAMRPKRERSGADFWSSFNLHERVHAYEARYIQRALIDAEGSVTHAARLLGLPHHATLMSMLEARHKSLVSLRTPPEKRGRSVLRVRAPRKAERFSAPKATRRATILYTEDNKLVARAVKDTLEFEGWAVELCADGASAINRLASGARYDLLLFDNDLPGARGVELIEYARRLAHLRDTPIIMLSASDCRTEALRAGASVFLGKPEEIDALVETVSRLLDNRAADGQPKGDA